jgi:hypothetical protein
MFPKYQALFCEPLPKRTDVYNLYQALTFWSFCVMTKGQENKSTVAKL